MNYPDCKAWASVLQTRQRKTDGATTRRYECANFHRFSTLEKVCKPQEQKAASANTSQPDKR